MRELRVLPGYAKRPELFRKYDRPKRLRISYSDDSSQVVMLADDPSLQRFPADVTAKSARVTILDVYRGTVSNETYLSEVEFGTAPAPTFDDPAAVLASARGERSADASPTPPSKTAAPATDQTTRAAEATSASPDTTSAPLSRPMLLLFAATLIGVSVVLWRQA